MTEPYQRPEEMGGDEILAGIVAAVMGLIGAWRWYRPLFQVRPAPGAAAMRRFAFFFPPLCFLLLLQALTTFSAIEVRQDARYVALFLVVGAGWLAAAAAGSAFLGISCRDDVAERSNPAAAAALGGALLGSTLCFAGSNMGEGPTIWTTIVPGALATLALFALWMAIETVTRVSEAVAVDRDLASGIRLGGFLTAAGLVLGRSVAGDWVSASGTVGDFLAQGWPAALLAAASAGLHRAWRPSPQRPSLPVSTAGIAPAVGLFALGLAWTILLGRW